MNVFAIFIEKLASYLAFDFDTLVKFPVAGYFAWLLRTGQIFSAANSFAGLGGADLLLTRRGRKRIPRAGVL